VSSASLVELNRYQKVPRKMTDPDTSNAASSSEILITPGEHDISRLVFHDPHTSTFNVGDGSVDNTMSYAFYTNDDGQECKMFFPGPPQNCFGVEYQYDINVAESDKNPSNAKGLQISYPLTSLSSVTNPKPEEKALISLIDEIWNAAAEVGKQEILRENLLIPEVSYNSFVAAEKRGLWTNALKKPMEHPNLKSDKNKKGGLDKTKPMRMYVKLLTKGRGTKLRVDTPFYGPGDKLESALKYIKKQGVITPCFWFEGIYWGAHGRNPQGASLRFKLVEANYVPVKNLNAPSHRMLGKNTAPPQEDDSDRVEDDGSSRNKMFNRYGDESDGEGESEDFAAPGSDSKNPIGALRGKSDKAPAKPKAKVAHAKAKVATATKQAAKPKAKVATATKQAAKPKAKVAVKVEPEEVEDWADVEVEAEEGDDEADVELDE